MSEETIVAPLPWGREVIEGILPHRDPFVWVSRIVAIEPGASIEGELDVPADLDIFRGHFPDHPVLPGVIIMGGARPMRFHRGAAIARAARVHRLSHRHRRGEVPPSGGPGRDGDVASDHREVVAPPRGGRGGRRPWTARSAPRPPRSTCSHLGEATMAKAASKYQLRHGGELRLRVCGWPCGPRGDRGRLAEVGGLLRPGRHRGSGRHLAGHGGGLVGARAVRPTATRRRRWPTSPSTSSPPSATTLP